MRIAQISPLFESVPPKLYGGTERVVSWITEELVKHGHEVTLFASGDSETSAQLVSICDKAIRLDKNCRDPLACHMLLCAEVAKHISQFDIIHSHLEYLSFPCMRHLNVPSVHTLHNRLDIPDLKYIYQEFLDMPLVSISQHQRRLIKKANWVATIYHGLPEEMFSFSPKSNDYLLFLGRFSPEKRPDRAIEIAKKSGMRLVIAAKIDSVDGDYYERKIKPRMDPGYVEYVGEVNDKDKNKLIGNAKALLFPIEWPEPFGLVMIEAMACGTPVIAFNHGSVDELITNGENGFKVSTIDEAVQAVKRIDVINRKKCREIFLRKYTSKQMMEDYVELYKKYVRGNPCF